MNERIKITPEASQADLKACCAALYQSDLARLLLGETFHPGGGDLTLCLGELLHLEPASQVLDVASGQGTSAILLAQQFGCQVQGIDYSPDMVQRANTRAQALGLDHLVSFQVGDAERLPFLDAAFDALLCECAFCTFPDKASAAAEFQRVLKSGGRLGLSDLTRSGDVPLELQGLLSWIACVADAQPVERYAQILSAAGFLIEAIEPHDEALSELVSEVQNKLLSAEILLHLKQIELPPTVNFTQAKTLARAAKDSIRTGQFGYVVLIATRPSC